MRRCCGRPAAVPPAHRSGAAERFPARGRDRARAARPPLQRGGHGRRVGAVLAARGERALHASANPEAIAHLTAGLDCSPRLPEGPGPGRRGIAVPSWRLGPAYMAIQAMPRPKSRPPTARAGAVPGTRRPAAARARPARPVELLHRAGPAHERPHPRRTGPQRGAPQRRRRCSRCSKATWRWAGRTSSWASSSRRAATWSGSSSCTTTTATAPTPSSTATTWQPRLGAAWRLGLWLLGDPGEVAAAQRREPRDPPVVGRAPLSASPSVSTWPRPCASGG